MNESEGKVGYYSIIPAKILYNKNLKANENKKIKQDEENLLAFK